MAHSKEKTQQINLRVSDHDLARLHKVMRHMDGSTRWLATKRPAAIWAAVELYIESNSLDKAK